MAIIIELIMILFVLFGENNFMEKHQELINKNLLFIFSAFDC